MRRRLIASVPILYRCVQYKRGDVLPVLDIEFVRAMLAAGSAKWVDEDEESEEPVKTVPKARLTTAKPGLPGLADPSSGTEDLVGRIPDTPERRGRPPGRRPRKAMG